MPRIFLFLLTTSLIWSGAARGGDEKDPLVRRYRLEIPSISARRPDFRGRVDLALENRGSKPLRHLVFVLYPNRFTKELPHLDDVNYFRIYPGGVSRGSLEIETMEDDRGRPLAPRPLATFRLPAGTFAHVALPEPIPPGGVQTFRISYRVHMPEKFGSFGLYRRVLTANGGWYPYVASYREGDGFRMDDLPPAADFHVRIGTDGDAVVAGRVFRKTEAAQTIDLDLPGRRQVSLLLAPKLRSSVVADEAGLVTSVSPEPFRVEQVSLSELVAQWLDFVRRQPEFRGRSVSSVLVTAPIREAMVVKGEGMLYVSDRAFKVFRGLRQYHSLPILHGLFYGLVEPEASRRESSRDWQWVADAVAWRWTERFMEERVYEHVDARTLMPVRWMSFLYWIDRLIYAPQFAFFDVFYNYVYPYDPVRDDVLTFNHRRPSGRTVYAHMEDDVGEETADRVAREYLGAAPLTYRALLERITKTDKRREYEAWTRPRPEVNYRLGKTLKRKTAEGWAYDIPVGKRSVDPVTEPVELRVRDRSGGARLLRWDGEGDAHTYHLVSPEKLDVIEIDPRRRLQETRLADNRSPPHYKFVLTDYVLNFDYNEKRPIAYLSGEFRRTYGGYNRYRISASYDINSYGASLGYARLFGSMIDRLRLTHGLGVSFAFNRLNEDLTAVPAPAGGAPAVVMASPAQFQSALTVGYSFGNQLSIINPLRGGGAGVAVTWGRSYRGAGSDYCAASLAASWILPFHPAHFLVLRGELAVSGPSGIPSQAQFRLGGLSGMRGVSVNDDRFAGRNLLLAGGEYRHLLIRDVDIDLLVLRIRDIQGAIFADAGRVSDTVYESAERAAFGSGNRTHFQDLFHPWEYETDVGYGIHFLFDTLGVNPGILRFDVAKSLSQGSEGLRFYFAVTQSF